MIHNAIVAGVGFVIGAFTPAVGGESRSRGVTA